MRGIRRRSLRNIEVEEGRRIGRATDQNSDTYRNLGLNKRGYVPTIRSADYRQRNAKNRTS
jgi:hypothetical protein